MKLFYDLFPIIVFFTAYKLYNIYVATAVAILAATTLIGVNWLRGQKPDMMQIITLAMIVFLGGATLIFRNELFIKWKPTVVYWILASVFGATHFRAKTLVQKMLENSVSLPAKAWATLNITWLIFFLMMGMLNLVVLYSFDTDTWVNFKLFGTLGLTVIFVLIQGVFISRFMAKDSPQENKT